MSIKGNKSGGRLYQPMGPDPYGTHNALRHRLVYSQINLPAGSYGLPKFFESLIHKHLLPDILVDNPARRF